MSIFHYLAVKTFEFEDEAVYRFYPKYLDDEDLTGKFKISLIEWKPIILETSNVDDERCVNALNHKIKKYYEQNGYLPEKIYHIS